MVLNEVLRGFVSDKFFRRYISLFEVIHASHGVINHEYFHGWVSSEFDILYKYFANIHWIYF